MLGGCLLGTENKSGGLQEMFLKQYFTQKQNSYLQRSLTGDGCYERIDCSWRGLKIKGAYFQNCAVF